jgi:UDP-glucose 4-epimerase
VREVLNMVEQVAGRKLKTLEEARRPGDPPTLVAGVDLIRKTLDWTPRYDDLEAIVSSALNWERQLQAGVWAA